MELEFSPWEMPQAADNSQPLGQRSLVGCRLWGRTESDTTEATQQQQQQQQQRYKILGVT